ncbi:MAG TPA: hypothetical protein PKE03_08790 [Bacteroidales bacterium]|jgi:hypothetical protein|nr:hypothetical protein [Bacteroidia bacterium]HMM12171.1 hypothetical protein [Bacteroidales bacterium]
MENHIRLLISVFFVVSLLTLGGALLLKIQTNTLIANGAILALAALKFVLVGLFFLEARSAHILWKLFVIAFPALLFICLYLFTFLGR